MKSQSAGSTYKVISAEDKMDKRHYKIIGSPYQLYIEEHMPHDPEDNEGSVALYAFDGMSGEGSAFMTHEEAVQSLRDLANEIEQWMQEEAEERARNAKKINHFTF